jgi:thioredoxin-like negative regulator of GroEL
MISCEDQQDKCAAEGVNGYPTVILYVAGKPIQFNGNRTSDALVAFVTQYI